MGSYYEEHFLRNMPWLVKNMKRPKVGEKKSRGTRKYLLDLDWVLDSRFDYFYPPCILFCKI
jgi:hypothetical protein